jgi:hypothetical protein
MNQSLEIDSNGLTRLYIPESRVWYFQVRVKFQSRHLDACRDLLIVKLKALS